MRSKKQTKCFIALILLCFSFFLFNALVVNACTYPDDCGQIGGCTGGKWCACCIEGEAVCYGPCDHGICCDGPNPTCCPESGCLDTENPTCDSLKIFGRYDIVYYNGFDSQADLDEWTIKSGDPIISGDADVGSDVYCPFYGANLLRGNNDDYRDSFEIKKIITGLVEGETYYVSIMAHPGCQHSFDGCEARGKVRLHVRTPEDFEQLYETNEGEYWQEFIISFVAGASRQATIYLKTWKEPRCWGKWGVTGAFDELMVYKVDTEVTDDCPADPNVGVSVTSNDDCGGSGNCDVLNMDVRFSNDGITWDNWVRHRVAVLPWTMDLTTGYIYAQVRDGEGNIDSCQFQCGATTTTTTTTTTTIPLVSDYGFDFWVESPHLFTIGKPARVNLYIKNTGSEDSSYSIKVPPDVVAYQIDDPTASNPALIDVSLQSHNISTLSTYEVGDTFATITVLGPLHPDPDKGGTITFIAYPAGRIEEWKSAEIRIKSEYSTSLPEFSIIVLMGLIGLSSVIYALKR